MYTLLQVFLLISVMYSVQLQDLVHKRKVQLDDSLQEHVFFRRGDSPLLERSEGLADFTVTHPNTKSLSSEGIFQSGMNKIVFDAKACHDADLELYPEFYLNIGGWGNTRSVLYDRKYLSNIWHYIEADEGQMLDCSSYKSFWVFWNGFQLFVGQGNLVGENVFISTETQCPISVSDVVLHSNWRGTASFRFSVAEEEKFDTNQFRSGVKSCSTMKILGVVTIESQTECASVCHVMSDCGSYAFNDSTGKCKLFSFDQGTDHITSEMIFWKY